MDQTPYKRHDQDDDQGSADSRDNPDNNGEGRGRTYCQSNIRPSNVYEALNKRFNHSEPFLSPSLSDLSSLIILLLSSRHSFVFCDSSHEVI